MENPPRYHIRFLSPVKKVFERIARNNSALYERIVAELDKISREPMLGKPLRYGLKNQRRLHVGSFVILYEITDSEVWILDFNHHDKIYKK